MSLSVTTKPQLINIEEILERQNNKFVKNLPFFIVNYLKKVIRQEELNDIIMHSYKKEDADFFAKNLEYMNISVQTENEHLMPQTGKYIFVANHSLGGIDGLAIIVTLARKYPKIKALVNEILMSVKNAQNIFLPVNVFGSNSVEKKKLIEKAYADSQTQIMTFPSGEVARKIKGKLDDGPWHRSFIRNAVLHQRNIIPIFVDAQNSKKFYFVSGLRRNLKIKPNLELFLLPQELIKQKGKTVKLIFGQQIPYTMFDDTKTDAQWAAEVKKIVYDLKKN